MRHICDTTVEWISLNKHFITFIGCYRDIKIIKYFYVTIADCLHFNAFSLVKFLSEKCHFYYSLIDIFHRNKSPLCI